MIVSKIFEYAANFLTSAADFMDSPFGLVWLAMILAFGVVGIWGDLRT